MDDYLLAEYGLSLCSLDYQMLLQFPLLQHLVANTRSEAMRIAGITLHVYMKHTCDLCLVISTTIQQALNSDQNLN